MSINDKLRTAFKRRIMSSNPKCSDILLYSITGSMYNEKIIEHFGHKN